MSNIGVLSLGRKRPGFDPQWGQKMEALAMEQMRKSEFSLFVPTEKIVDDSTLRTAIAECEQAKVDALVILQPTMSDGNLAATMAQLWSSPLILWATPEKQEGSMISACSLVGAHTFASTLRQLGHPFELVYAMPETEDSQKQLARAVRLASTVRRIHKGKVGLIGHHAPGFIDMHADPFQMKTRLGIQLRHASLLEFMNWMRECNDEEVLSDVQSVLETGIAFDGTDKDDLPIASRYYLTMKRWMREEHLDALSIRCWSELPNKIGQWPYLALARLATEELAVACEGDVDGAISCLIGNSLGIGQVYLSDWLEHDEQTVNIWHAGSAPFGLCEQIGSKYGPRLARHFNNGKPIVVNANIRVDMPVTLFRLWRCDNTYHLAGFEGQTIQPRRDLKGTNGLTRIDGQNVFDLFDVLCHAGMPHHVAVVEGHHADTLNRFARLMNLNWVTLSS